MSEEDSDEEPPINIPPRRSVRQSRPPRDLDDFGNCFLFFVVVEIEHVVRISRFMLHIDTFLILF